MLTKEIVACMNRMLEQDYELITASKIHYLKRSSVYAMTSCNNCIQEYIRDKSVQPRIRTVNHILQK